MSTLLVVDDDQAFTQLLVNYLTQEGFSVYSALNGLEALEHIKQCKPDLVILDYSMPIMSGIEVLALLRQISTVPVLMLTARHDDNDRIKGLELGADDYLGKPFNSRELVARIKAILRRTEHSILPSMLQPMVLDDLVLLPTQSKACWQNQELALTFVEYKLLELLVRQQGLVVSKQELAWHALKRALASYDRSIDVHVGHLRAKLMAVGAGSIVIRTLRGQGYQLSVE